ncbi:ABC transporter substrate-binding protein [Rugosimonospora africana]|uniref:ABC transporter substrate-binding protein n=1 Tax=Rugosimonospora africana TaxID=556532 RepID=A0A8J3QWE6_9ACTN|nr:ABC transporter substrate-binding protein [Rugosimonospora africana]GIH18108.1 ABC transporter substrate-binding protein [Rugosimonospora africana]
MLWDASRRRAVFGLVGAAALIVTLAGCGDSNGGGTPAGGAPSAAVDSALAAKVPASIKSAGKIIIGTDSTYAPSEFLATDGKTVQGFDVDLFNAVAAKLGLKTEWQSAKFDDIIPGVGSGKYNIGVSSFTINAEREQQVTMVSYFSAGTQWAAKAGASIDPGNACGKKVAVQTATVQVDDVTKRSKACTDGGKPAIKIDQYQDQGNATSAVVSGKDDAMLADSPVCAYAVKQTNGQLSLVGEIYESAPYGYVLPKDQADFGSALAGAVQALITDGSYKTILAKWGVEAGAITSPAVNPAS